MVVYTAHYHGFLSKVDPGKSYEVMMTEPSGRALKFLKLNASSIEERIRELCHESDHECSPEVLMDSYMGGIRKTFSDANEKYDVFPQMYEDGGWPGLFVPRVHMHEEGKIDLKYLISNSHKNSAFDNGEFGCVYLPAAELLKKEDTCMLRIIDEWNVPGNLLQRFNRFFRQRFAVADPPSAD
jgi:hypothetical protein